MSNLSSKQGSNSTKTVKPKFEVCPNCKCSYTYGKYLQHLKFCKGSSDLEPLSEFICNECNFITDEGPKLSKHLKLKHTFVECTKCQRSFASQSIYVHRHYCGKEAGLHCAHCDYVAKRKSDLTRHLYTHEKAAHVICPKCDKIFKNKISLGVHSRKCCNT